MALKVIGAGFGRTGTTSLKAALEILGFERCHNMREIFESNEQIEFWRRIASGETVDWEDVYRDFAAAVDWPTAAFCEELMDVYPDAKIILTTRNEDSWYESVKDTIFKSSSGFPLGLRWLMPRLQTQLQSNRKIVWDGVFGGRFEDREHAINVFRENTDRIQKVVPPERLLVHQPQQGWGSLCEFLERPVPDVPYPRKNERAILFRWVRVGIAAGVITVAAVVWLTTQVW